MKKVNFKKIFMKMGVSGNLKVNEKEFLKPICGAWNTTVSGTDDFFKKLQKENIISKSTSLAPVSFFNWEKNPYQKVESRRQKPVKGLAGPKYGSQSFV